MFPYTAVDFSSQGAKAPISPLTKGGGIIIIIRADSLLYWKSEAGNSTKVHPGVAKLGIALGSGPRGRGFKSRHSDQLRLLKKMQPLKPLLRQGFQPFQRTKSSTRRDGDAKGHFRDVG